MIRRWNACELFHLDLYRLETPEQIAAAGLEELLRSDGVTVIEWAEKMLNDESAVKNKKLAPGKN